MNSLFHLFRRHREWSWLSLIDWTVIVGCIALFTYLTLPNIVSASAYFDEGYSAYLAKLDIMSMAKYTALDVHPPLYYAVLHYWQQLFGSGVAELRLLSLVFAWVAVVLGFLIVKRLFGHKAAWVATILLTLSPLFIRYGSSMRMYTMALAIGLAATYVLLRAVTSKSRWLWVLYALLLTAGMWTNYFTALIWLTHLIWIIYEYRSQRSILKYWKSAVIAAIVLYLPWLPLLIGRASEIQTSGFWIAPVSVDTLVSTVTTSLVFYRSNQVTSWLLVGLIIFIVTIIVLARRTYRQFDAPQKVSFRLLLAISSLPVVLLVLMSLPPFRPAYVFRYVLFASASSSLLIAVTVCFARFNRHDMIKRFALYALTACIFVVGSYRAMAIGNRNLDTDRQNKLAQVLTDVHKSHHKAPVVLRSPYSYYAASLYSTKEYPTYFLYYKDLATIGSTKPLYDHPSSSVTSSSQFDKVWLVGEDAGSVLPPPNGRWKLVDKAVEYDDVYGTASAFANYYERIDT